ncbi:910_t:CDS:1, partial [Scutellospora calospora]
YDATITEPPQNDPHHENILLSIETKDFIDQGNTVLKLECFHSRSAQHLTSTTTTIKKGSTLFMNSDLTIVDDTYVVHLYGMNFCEYQKSIINTKNSTNLLWLNKSSKVPKKKESSESPEKDTQNELPKKNNLDKPLANETSGSEKVARTVALRVKGSRQKKSTKTKPYFRLNE